MASRVYVKKGNKKQVAPTKCSSNYINVKVVSPLETLNPNFRVNRDAPLKQLMIEWAAHANVDYTVCRFTHDGKRVQAHNTPKDFKMKDEDCIDAWTECGGGH
ncbi:ubiquitin-related domain-containing protein [Tanacetum coccineum]